MKLLDMLKEEIRKMNVLKRAWFTSFNLNPSFVERYILPALIGWEDVPRTVRDFESIMQIIHERKMDVRFFCDNRMLELDEGKRTTIDIHPLDITLFEDRFHYGVFHPKVILLQDEKDRCTLFCGSANLTIGGWAHNREGVVCREIESRENAEKVEQFFQKIFKAYFWESFPQDFAIDANEAEEDWRFSSTLVEEAPFPELLLTKGGQELVVWSPYFTRDMTGFLEKYQPEKSVHIIPDVQGNKIRIHNDNQEAFNDPNLCLKEYLYEDRDQDERMTHAKIWLTERQLAIGSWNMTEAGTGGNPGGKNNIEAGIILDVTPEFQADVLKKCQSRKWDFMDNKELEEDEPDIGGSEFPYNLSVVLDWDRRKYCIQSDEPPNSEKLYLKLPDQTIPFQQGEYRIKEEKIDNLLQNHMYILESDDKTVQTGFIKEIHCKGRPVWKYGNLTELMFSYITQKSTWMGRENQEVSYKRFSEAVEGPRDGFLQTQEDFSGISYFGMFQAFAGIRERLEKAMAGYEKDHAELNRLVRAYPGSIFELAEKIDQACDDDANNKTMSTVFKWYLKQECNVIIRMVKSFAEHRPTESLLNELAEGLTVLELPALDVPQESSAYLERIKERCGYASY